MVKTSEYWEYDKYLYSSTSTTRSTNIEITLSNLSIASIRRRNTLSSKIPLEYKTLRFSEYFS